MITMGWRLASLSSLAVLLCGQWPVCVLAQADNGPPQTVWRCSSEGRVAYGDQPCDGGRALVVSDPRSAADLAEARLVAQRERALAQQMVSERQERQRQYANRGSGLAGVEPAPVRAFRAPEPEPWQPPPRRRRPAAAV